MSRKPRVALMRNRIYPGGIFHVMLEMVRVLNQHGIVPDLVTLKSRVSPDLAAEQYNMDVQFRVREILTDLRIPYEWHIILFNKISQSHLQKYDLVINHNNTSFLYKRPAGQQLISYVHFPRKARGLSDALSTHVPEGPSKKWYHIRRDPFKLASLAYQLDTRIDEQEIVLANSAYTRQTLLDHYPIPKNRVEVLYPPVEIPEVRTKSAKDEQLVVSLGRFAPEKRQLEQLEIARKLPHLKFCFMGFLSDNAYFEQCENFKKKHNLQHVDLLPNLSYRKVNELLDRAGLFLHAIRNEPFGITTVEAISHGCIPVVPDSGGQVEIVPRKELRYKDRSEAIKIIEQLLGRTKEEKEKLRADLFNRIREFDIPNFQQQFNELLNQIQDQN